LQTGIVCRLEVLFFKSLSDRLELLLEIASTETAELAERMGCTLLEAQQERRLCAQAVLPYVAQKLPVQVDMRHTRAIHLNIVSDDQYAELQAVAQEPAADQMSLQVVMPRKEEGEGGRNVLPGVSAASPGHGDTLSIELYRGEHHVDDVGNDRDSG